jgi:hypothetical protein
MTKYREIIRLTGLGIKKEFNDYVAHKRASFCIDFLAF